MTNNYRYVITAYNSNNSDDDDTHTVMNELLGGQMVWNALGTLIEKLIYCQATEGASTQTTGDKCIWAIWWYKQRRRKEVSTQIQVHPKDNT